MAISVWFEKAERKFQLEKLIIEYTTLNGSRNVNSSSATGYSKNFEIREFIKRFDMNEPNSNTGIYLDLFERH